MMYGLLEDGSRSRPARNVDARCPGCSGLLAPKMGSINIHHWAHTTKTSCDYKSMTQWHYGWQEYFPEECVEVVFGSSRADVLVGNNMAIEFQSKPPSPEYIENKVANFFSIIWVANCMNVDSDRFQVRIDRNGDEYCRWYHPQRRWSYSPSKPGYYPLYLQVSDDELWEVTWEKHNMLIFGFKRVSKEYFINEALGYHEINRHNVKINYCHARAELDQQARDYRKYKKQEVLEW